MSISSEISRISGNVSDALTAIANKGVTVPSGSNSDDLADLIGQITGGGGTTWETVYQGTINCDSTWGDTTYAHYLSLSAEIPLNSVWRVTWDGVQYECTATWAGHPNGNPYAIGNYTYEDGGSGGTEYPFFVQRYWGTTWAIVGSVGQHTVLFEKQVSGGGSTLITKTITANGTYDAEDDDADGYSSVTVNVSGGGSSFSLLYSSEVNVTTSSTTNTTITSLSTGITFDDTKVYMVSVRDKAGKRNGYYFGTDTYFLPTTTTNSNVSANMTFYVDSNGAVKWTQTAYGVFLYKYYRGNNMGKIDINSRYSSSYGTINGTFTIKLYEVAIPNALT